MTNYRKNLVNLPRNAVLLLCFVLLLGSLLRFTNPGGKPYWLDETYTLLRASSYTAKAATEELFNGQVVKVADILRYQYPSDQDRGILGTITGLATEEPQHPPLYFLLTRTWAQLFGHDKSSLRALPAIASLLALPAIYWLCLELFSSPLVGLLAMTLVAVSPIQLRYAQEVRQYSLWTTLILLSCILVLRAIRQPTKLNWGLYFITIVAGIYSHLLMGLVVIAHGIYVLFVERCRLTKIGLTYLLIAVAALIAISPWIGPLWTNRVTVALTTEHFTRLIPLSQLAGFWGLSLDRIFVAWHFNYNPLLISLTIPIVFLILYGFYYLIRYAPRRTWLFILILIGTMTLPFLIPDLALGGRRSTAERYFLICYICIDIVVAHLLASKLTQSRPRTAQDYGWRSVTALLLLSGIMSCLAGAVSPTWWGWSEFDVNIAQMTNSTAQPLIISDVPFSGIVPFSHEVNPETQFILLSNPEALQIPDNFGDMFLYNPSERLLAIVKQRGLVSELVYRFQDTVSKLEVGLYQLRKTV